MRKASTIKIGKKLQTIRKSNGYTQEQLAEKVEVSVRYISDVEQDRAKPSYEVLVKICNTFEISLDQVFSEYLTVTGNKSLAYPLAGYEKLSEVCKAVLPSPGALHGLGGKGRSRARSRVVLRRSSRRQPEPHRAHVARNQAGIFQAAYRSRLQGDRGGLPRRLADRIHLHAQADRGRTHPRRRHRPGSHAGARAYNKKDVRGGARRKERHSARL